MKIIFVGTKNFSFFSKSILNDFEKIIITNKSYKINDELEKASTVIRVSEVYDVNSKTLKLDYQECIEKLSEIVQNAKLYRVFCNQESNLEVAEKIRSFFSIYDHMGGRVELFRDKLLMKQAVIDNGLRAPVYTELAHSSTPASYTDLYSKLKGKFIIKPSNSVGSRGVYKIFNSNDYDDFLKDTANDDCQFEAEEFISGELYEFDSALQNGEILYSNVSKYSCPMADLQEGKTLGSIMIEREQPIHQRITQFGIKCLKALKASDGCFHMELFHNDNDELVFLEVAARSPGLMTVPAYHCWEGVNMYDIELYIQSGLPASDLIVHDANRVSYPSFFIVYPKISGTVSKINTPNIDANIDIDWSVHPGQVVTDTTTNIDYAARFFVTCKNVESANSIFNFLVNEYKAVNYD
ncbi:ATP-grasp domain-containing protein [Klebsiella aerogenes]|nr:ATP-grasp domain-containing protein [Klebsiella aerogenes]